MGEGGRPEPHSKCLGRAGCGQHLGGGKLMLEKQTGPHQRVSSEATIQFAEPLGAPKQQWGSAEAPQVLGGWGESA